MREGAITSETEMDETGMKPRFHLKGVEVLVFMRCETGETEIFSFFCLSKFRPLKVTTRFLCSGHQKIRALRNEVP